MTKFIIQGGTPLSGEVTLAGAKNSGFKLMIAALLAPEKSFIQNFSKIGDVFSVAEIVEHLGGEVVFDRNHLLEIDGRNLKNFALSEKHGKLSRASTYFVGPLLAHFGRAVIPHPGGCQIGQRPLDRHLAGFRALGAKVKDFRDHYLIEAGKLQGTTYRFPKNTHGGTDVMLITSVFAEGTTILENAALEPEVDDLIAFLNKMGGRIKRGKNRTIKIEGVKKLKGATHTVMGDRNEAVTFGCAALLTKGEILVEGAQAKYLTAFFKKLREAKGGFRVTKKGILFFYKNPLLATRVKTAPYPGFMTDWQAIWAVLMTQAQGTSTIHETVFEKRFQYLPFLEKMGARFTLFNPKMAHPGKFYNFNLKDDRSDNFHAVKILGPVELHGTNLEVTDVRAGATITLAALAAHGKSQISSIDHIDRGYENLDGRLRALGAKITRKNF